MTGGKRHWVCLIVSTLSRISSENALNGNSALYTQRGVGKVPGKLECAGDGSSPGEWAPRWARMAFVHAVEQVGIVVGSR